MTHLDKKALEAAREQPGTNHDGIIRAYLSAIPYSPVGELVEKIMAYIEDIMVEAEVDYPAGYDAGARVSYDSDEIQEFITTTLSTRNAELEREVKRLREAVGLLETANSLRRNSSSDVVYEDYYDGLKVEDLEDQARALSTSPQGGEHAEG